MEQESGARSQESGVRRSESDRLTEAVDSSEIPAYNQLDSRVIQIWRIENLVWTLILFSATFLGSSALGIFTAFPIFLVFPIWIIFGSVVIVFSFWWPPRLYRSWSFRTEEKLIELKYGVVWQRSVMIPLSRVQHIDLERGPMERHFGLASLEIHTAGTQNATHKISGLAAETANQVREELIAEANLEI